MKKAESHSLPTLIGVAEEQKTAEELSRALQSKPIADKFPRGLDILLTVEGMTVIFHMNDATSVNNVLNEVLKQEEQDV